MHVHIFNQHTLIRLVTYLYDSLQLLHSTCFICHELQAAVVILNLPQPVKYCYQRPWTKHSLIVICRGPSNFDFYANVMARSCLDDVPRNSPKSTFARSCYDRNTCFGANRNAHSYFNAVYRQSEIDGIIT